MPRTPENRGHRLEAPSVNEPWDTILELVAGTNKEQWVIGDSVIELVEITESPITQLPISV